MEEIIQDHSDFRDFVDDSARHIRALIVEYSRQLQVLELQQAQFGLAVPPHIIIQIQNIRTELEKLRREIKSSETKTGSLIP